MGEVPNNASAHKTIWVVFWTLDDMLAVLSCIIDAFALITSGEDWLMKICVRTRLFKIAK